MHDGPDIAFPSAPSRAWNVERAIQTCDRISVIGVAPRSVSGIGRPTLDMFSFAGSTPRAEQIVAKRSGTVTGLSATYSPPSSVFP